MLLDAQALFSDNQAITTGTINSDNIVRFGLGDVSYMPVIIQVVNDFDNAKSVTVKVQTSASPDFSQSSDLVEAKLLLEDLKAGNLFPINYLPKGNKGYIRLAYVVEEGSSSETTGKITAGVVSSLEYNCKDLTA